MIKVFNIFSGTLCFLLMIHLLASNICNDYLLRLINIASIEQSLEIQEDPDLDSKAKILELDDENLVYFSSNFTDHFDFYRQEFYSFSSFHYIQIALPQSIHEILIPPPRA